MDFVKSTVYGFSRILFSVFLLLPLFKLTFSTQYCTPVFKYAISVSLFFPYHKREVATLHKTALTLACCCVFGYSVGVGARYVIK